MSTYAAPAFSRKVAAPVVSRVRRVRRTGDKTFRIISRDGTTRYDVLALKKMTDENPELPDYLIVCPCTAGQNGLRCWHANKVREYLERNSGI